MSEVDSDSENKRRLIVTGLRKFSECKQVVESLRDMLESSLRGIEQKLATRSEEEGKQELESKQNLKAKLTNAQILITGFSALEERWRAIDLTGNLAPINLEHGTKVIIELSRARGNLLDPNQELFVLFAELNK